MKKLQAFLSLALSICILLCSCGTSMPSPYSDREEQKKDDEPHFDDVFSDQDEDKKDRDDVTLGLYDNSDLDDNDDDEDEKRGRDEDEDKEDKSSSSKIRTIRNKNELSNYLNSEKLKDNLTVKFKYSGKDEFDAQLLARMVNSIYISYTTTGSTYTVTITEFPGDRMVDAYFSGDYSLLSSDEKKALDIADGMVQRAKSYASFGNDLEIELLLHDMLVEHISYTSPTTDVDDPENPPRHLTAVGAFLDGLANCQGYTDAFYVVASLAGFNVSRLSVDQIGQGGHMLNTIEIDGKWYLVDVTHNDNIDGGKGEEPVYMLFNSGKDMCPHLVWDADKEYNYIEAKSDGNMLYFLDSDDFSDDRFDYERVFEDVKDMAEEIVVNWYKEGMREFNMMLSGQSSDWSTLSAAIKNEANKTGKAYRYTIWTGSNGRDTFYYIKFE